jgi:predicted dehydrogenase
MKDVVGIGVVGAGSIGIRGALDHLTLPDVSDRVRVTAICDPAPGRAKAAGERYGVAGCYESLEELLADPAVDAITICSPIGIHYEQGLAAIRAGKHIHFNKTMTVTTAEATHLIDEAAAAGVILVSSPGQMTKPLNREIRRLILDGAIGDLSWAVTGAAFGDYHENESVRKGGDALLSANPAWYWRKPGGGPLYDMTVYGLHSLTGVLGPAKRVTAMSGILVKEREFQGKSYPSDADDNTLIVLDFGDARFAFVHGTAAGMVSAFGQPTYFGTRGVIADDQLNGSPIIVPAVEAGEHPNGPNIQGVHREMGENHVYEDTMQLVNAIREGTRPFATAEHARHVIEIIEAAYASAESGGAVALQTTFETV